MRTIITAALVLLSLTGCAAAPAAYTYEDNMRDTRGYPALDTADFGTDIPRCASDDYNSTHLPRCYTTTVEGAVLVIDQTDAVIASL